MLGFRKDQYLVHYYSSDTLTIYLTNPVVVQNDLQMMYH